MSLLSFRLLVMSSPAAAGRHLLLLSGDALRRQRRIGNRVASALEVRPFNERTSGSDSFIGARSARKNCAGGDGGKLLRFARRETADEIGRAASWLSPENSRADH